MMMMMMIMKMMMVIMKMMMVMMMAISMNMMMMSTMMKVNMCDDDELLVQARSMECVFATIILCLRIIIPSLYLPKSFL